MCGFLGQVPPAWVYTRFLKKLLKHTIEVDEIFEELVEQMGELLPGFGKHLAIDSKAIPSCTRRQSKNQTPDGRRDTDYGKKEYRGEHQDGSLWEKVIKGFGYKLPLVAWMPPMNCLWLIKSPKLRFPTPKRTCLT